MNTYICLKTQTFQSGDYKIVPLREEDILHIMTWRNDQIDVLRQKEPLTAEMQIKYYQEKIKPCFTNAKPEQILFSYLFNDMLIGYGGLVHINWYDRRGELSFLADTKRSKDIALYQCDFKYFISLIKVVAFKELELNRIHVETYDIRPYHVKVLEDEGFKFEGRLRQHVLKSGKFVDSLLHGFLREDFINEGKTKG